jgi:hypothetical protein
MIFGPNRFDAAKPESLFTVSFPWLSRYCMFVGAAQGLKSLGECSADTGGSTRKLGMRHCANVGLPVIACDRLSTLKWSLVGFNKCSPLTACTTVVGRTKLKRTLSRHTTRMASYMAVTTGERNRKSQTHCSNYAHINKYRRLTYATCRKTRNRTN